VLCFFVFPPRRYEASTGNRISDEEIAQCIGPCIKLELVSTCACIMCTETIECEVRALREAVGCQSCKSGRWAQAFLSCEDEATIPCMKRAGHGAEDFRIRPLRCCVPSNDVGPGVLSRVSFAGRSANASSLQVSIASGRGWRDKNHDRVTMRLRTYRGANSLLAPRPTRCRFCITSGLRDLFDAHFTLSAVISME